MKHSGLALANAAAASINFSILFYMLKKKLGRIDARAIITSFIKISIASTVTGIISWLIIRGDMWTQGGRTPEKAAVLCGIIMLFLALYAGIMHLLGSDELTYLMSMRKKKG